LKALSEASGVAGDEAAVRSVLRDAVKDHVDELRVDAIGNLITVKRAAGHEPDGGEAATRPLRVMLAAHMDEVGFMVIRIDKGGTLRFRRVGGVDHRILLAKVVSVGKNRLPGVIGVKPVHLIDRGEDERVVKTEDLVIDIGASSQEEAERLVNLGDRAMFATPFEELPPVVKGKAFDDRVGCAVLAELVRERYPVELCAVWTVQEEIGARGARVAAYGLEPDVAIALEGTICDELPRKKDLSPTTRMGAGPAITVMDRSLIADQRLVRLLIQTAEAEGLPYQLKQPGLGGTDAGQIHLVREGIPATAVAVPCRYIHAPAALMNPVDFDNTVRLMKAALNKLSAVSFQ
jgi:putative aminopeptidase FrvX